MSIVHKENYISKTKTAGRDNPNLIQLQVCAISKDKGKFVELQKTSEKEELRKRVS